MFSKISNYGQYLAFSNNDIFFYPHARQYLSQCMAGEIFIDATLLYKADHFFDGICRKDKLHDFLNKHARSDDAKYVIWLLKNYYIYNLFQYNNEISQKKRKIESEILKFYQLDPENHHNIAWYQVVDARTIETDCRKIVLEELAVARNFPDIVRHAIIMLIDTANENNRHFDAAMLLIEFNYYKACHVFYKIYLSDNSKARFVIDFLAYAVNHADKKNLKPGSYMEIVLMEKWLRLKEENKDKNLVPEFLPCLQEYSSMMSVNTQIQFIMQEITANPESGESTDILMNAAVALLKNNFKELSFARSFNFGITLFKQSRFKNVKEWLQALIIQMEKNNISNVSVYVLLAQSHTFHENKKIEKTIHLLAKAYKRALDKDGFDPASNPATITVNDDITVTFVINTLIKYYSFINPASEIITAIYEFFQNNERSVELFNSLCFSWYKNKLELSNAEIDLMKITYEYFDKRFIKAGDNINDSLIVKNWKLLFNDVGNRQRFYYLYDDIMINKAMRKESLSIAPGLTCFRPVRKDQEEIEIKRYTLG